MLKKMQVIGSRIRLFAQLAIAGLIMMVLIALTGSSSSSKPLGHATRLYQPVEGAATKRIDALYAGVPQHGAVLGDSNAPVTLQFFGDLECKEARQFVLGALPFLIRHWVRGGELRVEYHANPEETYWHDIYNHQQVAMLAAGMQGKGWNYLDFFYHEQGPEFRRYATEHFLHAIAAQVAGLDMAKWAADRHRIALTRHLQWDRRIARRHSIHYTPAFLVGPTGGPAKPLLHFSLTETAAFDEAIEAVLRGSPNYD
jgi:protein-disulfide isomerase